MAIMEGPEGQPPSAWVWSHYRGVQPDETTGAEAVDPPPAVAAPATAAPAQQSSLIGLGIAAAVIVIAGLTWLFTTRPAADPGAQEPPAATGTESAPQKSEAAPPAAEPAAASATTAPPAATPATAPADAKPAAPAAASPPYVKKKKPHHG